MSLLPDQAQASADFLQEQGVQSPDLLVILGSGWGELAQAVTVKLKIPYSEILHFPQATVPGHGNTVLCAEYGGKSLLILTGRFHYYEGYSLAETTFPVRVAALMGAKGLITTNAAGGLRSMFQPGDLFVISDHINFLPDNPLRGIHGAAFGSRFVDLVGAYDPAWQELAHRTAEHLGVRCHRGVYVALPGPNYETPAEIKMLQRLGGDVVGMSTVPEVIVARQMGLRVLGLSCITNLGAGLVDQPLDHGEVLTVGQSMGESFRLILGAILSAMKV